MGRSGQAGAPGDFPQLAAVLGVAGPRAVRVLQRPRRRRPGRPGRRGGGATAGMFPQDRGRRGGERTGLEPLPDPPPGRSLPPPVPAGCAAMLPNRDRRGLPAPPLPWAGRGVPGCRGCRWGTVPREHPGTPGGCRLALSRPPGQAQERKPNFIFSPSPCVCAVFREPASPGWMLHCPGRQTPSRSRGSLRRVGFHARRKGGRC